MSQRRRVAVTGIGVLSALGIDRRSFLEGLREGHCGLARCSPLVSTGPDPWVVGQVFSLPGIEPTKRADELACAAARAAIEDARIHASRLRSAAVILGVGAGGADALYQSIIAHDEHGAAALDPALLGRIPAGHTADEVGRLVGTVGPCSAIMTACSASAAALGHAADLVRSGRAPIALAGGVEPLSTLTLGGFAALRALSPEPCRPFDAERTGLSVGEGSAILVLEPLESALARDATVYAELAGWGASSDAHHMTAPQPEGLAAARAIRAALADADVAPGDVEYVNAHGTGTQHNDLAESRALHAVFGERAADLAVGSTKSQVGHTLGAAGAIEAAATVLGLAERFLPPTVNTRTIDPACRLDHVLGRAREAQVDVAISNSFGFGGNNVCLVFRAVKS